ncbi:hypothetical protein [Demequina litorisediminis]|uniref:Uncharacterized protein n=1 Tax=Demequina litorisediminis TaxID=1849022 RepID=A0ABQ6IJS2_9MICO|nr:hypothetical protein [Demequina litorisediminis]GMA36967.1 hypothetical protein GCM10025876_31710 [Demequina litorisediminis]
MRVAGDDHVGFYRSRHAALEHGIVEAFSWGGLTSGRRSTALWLFLAPFALVNVAGWMLPREQQDDSGYERAARGRAERWRNGGVRVVTLMMTGLLALAGLQSALALLGLLDATRASGPPLLATAVLVGDSFPWLCTSSRARVRTSASPVRLATGTIHGATPST